MSTGESLHTRTFGIRSFTSCRSARWSCSICTEIEIRPRDMHWLIIYYLTTRRVSEKCRCGASLWKGQCTGSFLNNERNLAIRFVSRNRSTRRGWVMGSRSNLSWLGFRERSWITQFFGADNGIQVERWIESTVHVLTCINQVESPKWHRWAASLLVLRSDCYSHPSAHPPLLY